jgi:hypothetical protein
MTSHGVTRSAVCGTIESSLAMAGAMAVGAKSFCRASVRNGPTATASWQPPVRPMVDVSPMVAGASWHPVLAKWSSVGPPLHQSSQPKEATGLPASVKMINSDVTRSISPLRRASRMPSQICESFTKRLQFRWRPCGWPGGDSHTGCGKIPAMTLGYRLRQWRQGDLLARRV